MSDARRRRKGPALLLLTLLAGAPAYAGAKHGARVALREGDRALSHLKYRQAAEAFLRSDSLAPNEVALEKALKAAAKSRVSVLVMYLVSRAQERKVKPPLKALARSLGDKHRHRVGRLRLECGSDPSCTAQVSEGMLRDGQGTFVEVGTIGVAVTAHGTTELQDVEVTSPGPTIVRGHDEPSATEVAVASAESEVTAPLIEVTPALAPVAVAPRVDPPRKTTSMLKPALLWASAGATALAAGCAIASGVDTQARHASFQATRTTQDREAGLAAQTRTNVLWVTTGVLAATSAVSTILFTDLFPGLRVGLVPGDRGAGISMGAPW